jgi:hypothetical protein
VSDWTRLGNAYVSYGFRIRATVYQDGEVWRHLVTIPGDGEISKGEWASREDAINNANGGMSRACFLRRFDKDGPVLPDGDDDDDDTDDDDDE